MTLHPDTGRDSRHASAFPSCADVDTERSEFIAWWTKNVPEDYRESTRQHMRTFFEAHGRFPNPEMHGGWNGWQAAKGMK